jgi:NADH-quinone oxidoreductase subunit C
VITEGGILDALNARFPGSIEVVPAVDQASVRVDKDILRAVMEWLRLEQGYELLLDVCGVDWFPARPRFEVVYHVYNPTRPERLRVKVLVGQNEEVESMTAVWPGANWPEREAFDLMGITFRNHPDLTRIYMPEDWEGHPLRKDYPVAGPRVD